MEYVHWTELVDESKLNRTDRLALAVFRLSQGQWDPILGPKPDGFDDLPGYVKPNFFTRKQRPCKYAYFTWVRDAVISIIGDAALSRFHWVYGRRKTEEAWLQWYISRSFEGQG